MVHPEHSLTDSVQPLVMATLAARQHRLCLLISVLPCIRVCCSAASHGAGGRSCRTTTCVWHDSVPFSSSHTRREASA